MLSNLQDRYSPTGVCFGCGPRNAEGLRLKSFVEGDVVVAAFTPQERHCGFPGMLNGGIIGTIFDCHMNWTAAYFLMKSAGADEPPCTVTGNFRVDFQAPTPMDQPLRLESQVIELGKRKAKIAVKLFAEDVVTATGEGVFVAVKEGHPAFNHW